MVYTKFFTVSFGVRILEKTIAEGKYVYSSNILDITPFLIFALFNTATYLYSRYLTRKYGADLFGDLDQNWLREFQGYDPPLSGKFLRD